MKTGYMNPTIFIAFIYLTNLNNLPINIHSIMIILIKTIIRNIISKNTSKPLGRWKIEYCNNKINKKVDLSNEDHCGPCGYYTSKYIKQPSNNTYSSNKKE